MRRLKRVGFFRELPYGDPNGPSLSAAIRNTPSADEELVIRYLKSGVLLIATPGIAFDILADPQTTIGTAPHILTDGEWAWPGDLAYYLETYHCVLPSAFVEHVQLQQRPPAEERIDVDDLSL